VDFGFGGPRRTPDASIRLLGPTNETVIVTSVRDAATQAVAPVSPGKIVVLYGAGMGPANLLQNRPAAGKSSSNFGGTEVLVNGIPAPILYTSSTQVSAIIPRATAGESAQIAVRYSGRTSQPLQVKVAPSSPGIFSANGTGAGQAAALNPDGSYNDAAHPIRPGELLKLFVTGEGLLPDLSATIGGLPAKVASAAVAVDGALQVLVEIPLGVEPGGYVPISVHVNGASSPPGASWIAVAPAAGS